MNDQEKIEAAVTMLKKLKRMVGFFMKSEISVLIDKLEQSIPQKDHSIKNKLQKQEPKTSWKQDSNLF